MSLVDLEFFDTEEIGCILRVVLYLTAHVLWTGVSQGERVEALTPNVTISGGDRAYNEVVKVQYHPKGGVLIQQY